MNWIKIRGGIIRVVKKVQLFRLTIVSIKDDLK